MMDFDQLEKQILGSRQSEFPCMKAHLQEIEHILLMRLYLVKFLEKAIERLNFPAGQSPA